MLGKGKESAWTSQECAASFHSVPFSSQCFFSPSAVWTLKPSSAEIIQEPVHSFQLVNNCICVSPRGQHSLFLCTDSTGRLIYRTKVATLQRYVLFSLGLSMSLVFQRWTELDLIKPFCLWEKPSLPHPLSGYVLIPTKVQDRHQCEATYTQSLSICQNQHCCTSLPEH